MPPESNRLAWKLSIVAFAVGILLMIDCAQRWSATYDEVEYLQLAARWYRTGDQEVISRMGSPLTFWKLQQAPVLFVLDHLGYDAWIDDPITHQANLLPVARLGALWIWAVAAAVTAAWSRSLYGPWAMAASAWWFALSPNLLAHGALLTMELPIVAAWGASFFLFWRFLESGRRRWFVASAAAAGLAFSCKFTAILLPPLIGLAWAADLLAGQGGLTWPKTRRLVLGMLLFGVVLLATDLVITGFATLTASPRVGNHPSVGGRWGGLAATALERRWPSDWVGLANQLRHQRSGGSSYLFGERRETGWRYYYFVALAVKAPLALGLVLLARGACRAKDERARRASRFLLVPILGFLAVTAAGSSRNYGVRYLLPLAPLAIVWISGLAVGPRWGRALLGVGLAGQLLAVASIHPHELSYFNRLAGGPAAGRHILADSNLDWGQGALKLARLQREHPWLNDLTTYYFGDTDPAHYGVAGRTLVIDAHRDHPGLPDRIECLTDYLAVSSSLQHGPWGPAGYFDSLRGIEPIYLMEDATIAIYRASDLPVEVTRRTSERRE